MSAVRVKFGEVVSNLNETVRQGEEHSLTRVVGLEHIEPQDPDLRRWDELSDLPDGTSFSRVFRQGQVLFGKRRAYQRKVAVAPFDGICSSDILVFAPANKKLHPDFLLFIVQSEGFFSHALQTSSGSLSPRTRWQDLATYEFELPSIEEQQRIVELLSGVDAHAEALRNQLHVAKETRKSVLHQSLTAGGDDWTETTLGKVGESGFFSDGDWVESKDQDPKGNCRLVQLADIGDGMFLDKSDRWLNDEQFLRLRCTALKPRDILIARMPDPAARACLFPDGLPKSATVVDVAILRCSPDVLPEFLMPLINDSTFRNKAISLLTGTTRQRIARSKLASMAIFLPPLKEQQRIVDEISKIDAVIQETTSAFAATRQLRSALLNKEIS